MDTYNILISGCCESEMLDLALDLFNEMKTYGIIWNFVTCDTLSVQEGGWNMGLRF